MFALLFDFTETCLRTCLSCSLNGVVNMEWTKSETLKFINLLQGFPCLWDSKNKDYRNRQKRHDALEYLAQEANTNINSVEKKYISLRTQYNRELHKIKTKSEAGLDEVPTSSWYAFDQMNFLKDHRIPRPSTDSLMITYTQNQKEENADPYNSSQTSTNLSTDNNINEQFPKRQSQRRCKIRKTDIQRNTLNLLKHASNAIINKQKKDDFSIFGETVANELRGIKSKKEILELKKKIMDLIYITKINILDAVNTTSISPPPNPEENLIEKENISGSSDFNLYVGKIEMVVDGQWKEEDTQEI